MGIFDRIKSIGKKSIDPTLNRIRWTRLGGGVFTGSSSYDIANAVKGWVFVAVNAIAEDVSKTDWNIVDSKGEVLEDHAVAQILMKPNKHMTNSEFMHRVVSSLEVFGHFVARVEKTGAKKQIIPLDPLHLQIDWFEDKFDYRYRYFGKILETKNLIHIRHSDVLGQMNGKTRMDYIADWVLAESESNTYLRTLLKNGTFLSGWVQHSSPSKDARDRYAQQIQDQNEGAQKAGSLLHLPPGLEFHPNDINLSSVQMSEMDKTHRDKILSAFGVPKTRLGISETGDSKSDSLESRRTYAMYTLDPLACHIFEAFNNQLIPLLTPDDVKIEYVSPIPDDEFQKAEIAKIALGGAPWMSRDEVRRDFALGESDGGDTINTPANLVPSGEVKKEAPKGDVYKTIDKILSEIPFDKKKVAEKSTHSHGEDEEAKAQEYLSSLSDDEKQRRKVGEAVRVKFVRRNSAFEDLITEEVTDVIRKMKRLTIENLPEFLEKRNLKELGAELIPPARFTQEMIDAVQLTIRRVLLSEHTETAVELGLPETTPTSNYQAVAEEIAKNSSESFASTWIDSLSRKVSQLIVDGEGLEVMTERLSDWFDGKETRARTFARSTVFSAANQSRRNVYQESGVVQTIKYHTASDELVCPFCRSFDGNVYRVDEQIVKQGETITVDGQNLEVIMSGGEPPLHPNCRCFILPEDISIINA